MSQSSNGIKRIFEEDWYGHVVLEICTSIFDYLWSSSTVASHLTYGALRNIIGEGYSDEELMLSVQYLCGDRVRLLNSGFELIDGEEVYELEPEEVSFLQETGVLIHPETGHEVEDGKKKVFIFFKSSGLIEKVRGS